MQKKIQLYVLIPDKTSGDYFAHILNQHNIATEYGYHPIHPRVIHNKLTTSNNVVQDMNHIFQTFQDKTRSIVIACNTLQLWLNKINPAYKKNVKVYTTFEACEWKFHHLKNKPLWLGTTPLVQKTKKFPTLLTYQRKDTQNQVQELIWRIKMLYGDDIQTAFDSVKQDRHLTKNEQLRKIHLLKKALIATLKSLRVKKVILGCTELPIIFQAKESGIHWIDPAEVLAEYVKHQSVILLFAGGTISSLANTDGTLIGGKQFNLLEKLAQNMPGSFRRLNITKSDIVYSGLSENMTYKTLSLLWRHIKESLEATPARIVITHGTDAMEHVAKYISRRVKQLKTNFSTYIIFTGSNIPSNKKNTDVWHNMHFAINTSIPQKFSSNRVLIAFDNKLINADEAVKIFSHKKSMCYLSKQSREYKQYLQKQTIKINNLKQRLMQVFRTEPNATDIMVYEVNRIRLNHNQLLKAVAQKNPRALLFKLYHSGTANTQDAKLSVARLVARLTAKGIVCFGATENNEPTNLKKYETSVKLLQAGMIPLYDMPFDIAHFKLSLLHITQNHLNRKDIIHQMLKNYAGEINSRKINKRDFSP